MSVVVVPDTAADRDQQQNDRGRNEPWSTLFRKPEPRRPRIVGSATCKGDRDNGKEGSNGKPINNRPEKRWHEVAITIHVGVRIGRSAPDEVERVLPAKVIENRRDDEDTDDNSVADKFIGDNGLNKKSKEDEGEDLRKG